ncbi:MAG TPA: O-antigen ligase family protein [Gemmatimonadaceae bacterium]|jgi:exopolysaccharide production protein ExoQ|nr:O-antigen ligase family protein [Gemmatimonadaceae bacterium]
MSTAAVSQAFTPARVASRRRGRPWLGYLVLVALFCVLGPYDLHNRADHEDTQEASVGTLKTIASGQGAAIEEGNIGRRLGVIGLGLFAVTLLWRARRRGELVRVPAATRSLPDRLVMVGVVGYLLIAAGSVTWGEEPGLTARRVFVFLILCLTAYALARVWSLADFMVFIIVACGAMLMASLGLDVVRGAFHPASSEYRLAGLTHPNSHAIEASAVVIAAVCAMRLEPERRRLYAWVAVVGVVLLLLTRSRTALVGMVVGIAAVPMLTVRRRQVVFAVLGLVAVVIVATVFLPDMVNDAKQALLLGRSQQTADVGTLTGRTDLWEALLLYVRRRPLLGYGFDAFWTPDHIEAVTVDQGWLVSHAHSTYIENLLNLGMAGLAAFVLSIVAGIWAAARRVRQSAGSAESAFALTALVWLAASMVTEAIMPQTHYGSLIGMVVLAWLVVPHAAPRTN